MGLIARMVVAVRAARITESQKVWP